MKGMISSKTPKISELPKNLKDKKGTKKSKIQTKATKNPANKPSLSLTGTSTNTLTSSWVQIGDDIDGEAGNDHSGYSGSLSGNGTIIAIGAPRNDGNGSYSGHVRVYSFDSKS